jgi:hypothetical protein
MTRFERKRNGGDKRSGRDGLCAGTFTETADRTPWGKRFARIRKVGEPRRLEVFAVDVEVKVDKYKR